MLCRSLLPPFLLVFIVRNIEDFFVFAHDPGISRAPQFGIQIFGQFSLYLSEFWIFSQRLCGYSRSTSGFDSVSATICSRIQSPIICKAVGYMVSSMVS